MAVQSETLARRVDLDWVRIAAFGLLILYHVGMLYVPWFYHVKSAHVVPTLVPFMLALNPWRLGLLFLVSGAATRFMAARMPPGHLLGWRSVRLLPPLIFGIAVIVPPQSYLQVVSRQFYSGDYWDFYIQHYLAFAPQFCNTGHCLWLPTWNHLWFVAYVWVYTIALLLLLALLPDVLRRMDAGLTRLLSGVLLLVLPAVVLAFYQLVLSPRFPKTNDLVDDWYNHALYASLFLLGFLIARSEPIWTAMVRWRWPALTVAATLFASYLSIHVLWPASTPTPVAVLLYGRVAYGLYQWCCIVTALGFAHRWITRDSPLRRYLTEAVFPYYIVHQTVIVAAAYALREAGLPAWLEAIVIISITAAGCALSYEIVRRVAWLRPLFGLKWPTPAWTGSLQSLPPDRV